ncbi:hypothetical protein ACWCWD_29620 [Streptomyces sp. NPDC001493]
MSKNSTVEQQPHNLSALGELVHLDPREIQLDDRNARKENSKPDAALLSSVALIGVQEPIGVRRSGQGEGSVYVVYKGQRRWLAAREAAVKAAAKGQPIRLIPAFVRDDLNGDDAETLLLSLVENTQRVRMTDRDAVNGAAQLELIGLDEAGRRRSAAVLGIKRDALKAAKKAAALTPAGLETGAHYGFDLTELADLQEVERVADAAVTLHQAKKKDVAEKTPRRGHWQHAMSRLRQELQQQEKRAAIVERLTASGVRVIEGFRQWDATDVPLAKLTTSQGKAIASSAHAKCPGRAARLDGNLKPVYCCTDPERYGHLVSGVPVAADVARAKELARIERRNVVERNRAARAAREVRQEFVSGLCKGKGISDAAWVLVLETMMNGSDVYRRFINRAQEKASAEVSRYVGAPVSEGANDPFSPLIARTGKARRPLLLLAQVAAAFEAEMHDRAWSVRSEAQRKWLEFLVEEGYTLSDHESGILHGERETEGAEDQEQQGVQELSADLAEGDVPSLPSELVTADEDRASEPKGQSAQDGGAPRGDDAGYESSPGQDEAEEGVAASDEAEEGVAASDEAEEGVAASDEAEERQRG